jgi:hypothetical protein
MIPSEPLNTSSALAPEEINPNKQCEQCKEAVGGRSQRNCTKLVLQTATTGPFRDTLCSDMQMYKNDGNITLGAQRCRFDMERPAKYRREGLERLEPRTAAGNSHRKGPFFKINFEDHMPCAASPYWSLDSLAQQRAVSQRRKTKRFT